MCSNSVVIILIVISYCHDPYSTNEQQPKKTIKHNSRNKTSKQQPNKAVKHSKQQPNKAGKHSKQQANRTSFSRTTRKAELSTIGVNNNDNNNNNINKLCC